MSAFSYLVLAAAIGGVLTRAVTQFCFRRLNVGIVGYALNGLVAVVLAFVVTWSMGFCIGLGWIAGSVACLVHRYWDETVAALETSRLLHSVPVCTGGAYPIVPDRRENRG